ALEAAVEATEQLLGGDRAAAQQRRQQCPARREPAQGQETTSLHRLAPPSCAGTSIVRGAARPDMTFDTWGRDACPGMVEQYTPPDPRRGSSGACPRRAIPPAEYEMRHAADTTSPIIPCLRYRDAPAAIEWLCRAFGFEKHAVYAEGDTVHHAQ